MADKLVSRLQYEVILLYTIVYPQQSYLAHMAERLVLWLKY